MIASRRSSLCAPGRPALRLPRATSRRWSGWCKAAAGIRRQRACKAKLGARGLTLRPGRPPP